MCVRHTHSPWLLLLSCRFASSRLGTLSTNGKQKRRASKYDARRDVGVSSPTTSQVAVESSTGSAVGWSGAARGSTVSSSDDDDDMYTTSTTVAFGSDYNARQLNKKQGNNNNNNIEIMDESESSSDGRRAASRFLVLPLPRPAANERRRLLRMLDARPVRALEHLLAIASLRSQITRLASAELLTERLLFCVHMRALINHHQFGTELTHISMQVIIEVGHTHTHTHMHTDTYMHTA
jgi:hypothetical protein